MTTFYKSLTILVWTGLVLSTIPGLSFMDLIRESTLGNKLPGEDPCNPLYWYPKTIPNYCYFKAPVTITITEKPHLPVLLPVPVPLPASLPLPNPVASRIPVPQLNFPGLPIPLPKMPSPPPILTPPVTSLALSPLYSQSPRVAIALASPLMAYGTNLQPHFPFRHPIYEPQTGHVPGLPGLVTDNCGINIMPLPEAHADMLERHKNNMIRRKVQRIFNEYEYFPNSRKYLRFIE